MVRMSIGGRGDISGRKVFLYCSLLNTATVIYKAGGSKHIVCSDHKKRLVTGIKLKFGKLW